MPAAQSTETRLNHLFWIPPALLFISAALAKSLTPLPFLIELPNYRLPLSPGLQALLAALLPAVEMFLGMMLLLRRSRLAAIGILAFLLAFSVGIVLALPTGYLHHCGCMGPEAISPFWALTKNAAAMLLLIAGFFPQGRRLEGANPWAAFALMAGATWTGSGMLVIYLLGAILAGWNGPRHLMGYGLSLLLGLILHLANFPVLAAIAIATILYFFRPESSYRLDLSPLLLGLAVLALTAAGLVWPPQPEAPALLLKIGQPWPKNLKTEEPLAKDAQGRSLVLFLRTDCDECRDWMPRALEIAQRPGSPPLTGLAPQSPADIAVYRRREAIPFPVYSVDAGAFDQAVRRTPLLALMERDTVKEVFEEGGLPSQILSTSSQQIPPLSPLFKGGNNTSTQEIRLPLKKGGQGGVKADQGVNIWITGALHGQWLPHGPYGQPLAGGASRIARALDLYRRPGDLLLDLGQFRYPAGISGETRSWRLHANGFLKTLLRMNYTALNVTAQDTAPIAMELQARAKEYGLPLVDEPPSGGLGKSSAPSFRAGWGPAELYGSIILTDAPAEQLDALATADVSLILWLNPGAPVAKEINGVLVLGMGDSGVCLGRIEIRNPGGKLSLNQADVSAWTDGKPWRHHPARESLLRSLGFGKQNPNLVASLWQVPEELVPEKQAETQHTQTIRELSDYSDLKDLHQQTSSDYTGPDLCRTCHSGEHPRNLAQEHAATPPQVLTYPVYERCFGCHATGFDEPGGFLEPAESPDLLAVTCEACHGPGVTHANSGGAARLSPPDSTACQQCHDPAKRPGEHP